MSQVEHHRNVVRVAQLKLQKLQGVLQDPLERSQSTIQVEAAKAASASVVPPMPPPSVPPEDTLPVNADDPPDGQIQEIQEGDEEMEEVDEEEDNGSGVGRCWSVSGSENFPQETSRENCLGEAGDSGLGCMLKRTRSVRVISLGIGKKKRGRGTG